MIIEVRVRPKSSKESIVKLSERFYKIYMRKPATEGKANKHLIRMLSKYFGIRKSAIKIKSGLKSENKIIAWERQ